MLVIHHTACSLQTTLPGRSVLAVRAGLAHRDSLQCPRRQSRLASRPGRALSAALDALISRSSSPALSP